MSERSLQDVCRSIALSRRQVLGGSVAAGGALLWGASAARAETRPKPARRTRVAAGAPRHIRFHRFEGIGSWASGTRQGVAVTAAGLRIGTPTGTVHYADPIPAGSPSRTYDVASWVSPVQRSGFALTELIASWNADTPKGTWVQIDVRGRAEDGTQTGWFVLGRWCRNDPDQGGAIRRTSVDGQGTAYATVWTDTLHLLNNHSMTDFQLRVQLMRLHGTSATPTVRSLGAMASALPDDTTVPVSTFTLGRERILNVPTYSQEVHAGHYPQWSGGGEAWCSPTSSSMVLASWGLGPSKADLSWVQPPVDAQVDYAARDTFDYTYDGCGNWPFNTAYTGSYGLDAFVTRLRSLAEAEAFIAAGIPVITAVSFDKSELDGAGYSTAGHLMVLVGFTAAGDPVMNDPASHLKPDDAQVRVTYKRAQFENVWIPRSGGTAYINHPASVRLPRAPQEANW
ncbi:C39 family peptidase [Flexivirga sp. ID2601S]|uniref:C39 family peptidase n=1 Tax=Flexivirga aerilata TaxID=1656889 RepID=A0A849AHG7_9MICO|nr:C39 family peptidase [Flexivirga aerilata]NNG39895.1 C39 family peptidase [Flexivirga aerilata]